MCGTEAGLYLQPASVYPSGKEKNNTHWSGMGVIAKNLVIHTGQVTPAATAHRRFPVTKRSSVLLEMLSKRKKKSEIDLKIFTVCTHFFNMLANVL